MIPHEKTRLLRVLDDLNLPEGQWFLSGSGVLVMHGIDRGRPMGDVDIFLATRPWFELYHEGLVGIIREPESFQPWRVFTTEPTDSKRIVDPPYLYKEMHGIEVNVFYNWRRRNVGDIDVAHWMINAEKIEGVPCTPLQYMLDWKMEVGRAKDTTDIERIREHLERKKK